MINVINKDNFDEEVVKASQPVLLDFWGPACGPCLALMPAVEVLAEKYQGKVKICKINSAENRRLCINLRVVSLPTFILYNNGQEIKRLGPEVKEEDIKKCLEDLTASAGNKS